MKKRVWNKTMVLLSLVMIVFLASINGIHVNAANSYTITYNANGGVDAPEGQIKIDGVTLILSDQEPTRDGYLFRGWSTTTNPDRIYSAGAEYDEDHGAKFYAIWSQNEYTISYNANGGYGAPENQKKVKDVTLTLSTKKPYRKGYEFKGWSTTTHPEKIYAAGETYDNNFGAKFYAIWKKLDAPADPQSGLNKITLSGNHDDYIVTDRYSYVEGEKFFLLLDKDIVLPGDFANNVAMIMDKLEELSGLQFSEGVNWSGVDFSTCRFGYDPWEELNYGVKVPIALFIDREACGYISSACEAFASLDLYELYSDEIWNNVPSYAENPWKRQDYVDYKTIAHELTHTLTLRNVCLTRCLTEGLADYYAEQAMDALAFVSNDFYQCAQETCYNYIAEALTSENAERIFVEDFRNLSHAQRGDEYVFGRMLGTFLAERYGNDSIHDYFEAILNAGYDVNQYYYSRLTEDDCQNYANLLKSLCGDDVFEQFGAWYQTQMAY